MSNFSTFYLKRQASGLPWATVDPKILSGNNPHQILNLIDGNWVKSKENEDIIDPLNGEKFLKVPLTNSNEEITQIKNSMEKCPKSGLHNPLKNVDRYNLYGKIFHNAAAALDDTETRDFFIKLIQRVMPKSEKQAAGEIDILKIAFQNFSGDQPRFLCRGFSVAGDYDGQFSSGYRWPYGPVSIICPFNFPIEIPILQLIGALVTGNKVLIKTDSKVSLVLEQFMKMLIHCGMPAEDVNYINCQGPEMEKILTTTNMRMTQFTGSSKIANYLAEKLKGKIKIEDAGYDWKVLGPDVFEEEYVAYTCDQDAYAMSGQKCSAQSILFMHENWAKSNFVEKLKNLAARRSLSDFTITPVLSWSNERIKDHLAKVLSIPGAKVLFGGKELTNHTVPEKYGLFEPTAVFVPLESLSDEKYFELATTELFGPFQIITEYKANQVDIILNCLERMDNHLTAAIVSNDQVFANHILSNTINGTTYAGIRARTTGAPQNHWFGPSGDPRCAGIGTPEAILAVWTCHREIIRDVGPIPSNWKLPPPS